MSSIALHCELSIPFSLLKHYTDGIPVARENGAQGNGDPGVREEMSRYPYYAAFAVDMEGNNVEAVCAPREARKS